MANIEEKNPVGRPRIHDRDQIALELIEWAKQGDSINLNKFCCTREPPIPPSKITQWAKESIEFRQAYETAKAFLGFRREEWLTKERLHVKAYDLNATTYDAFLREERREQSAYESSLKKEEISNSPTTINLVVPHDGLGSGLRISTEGLSNPSHTSSQ